MEVCKKSIAVQVPVEFLWIGRAKKGVKLVLEDKLNKWDHQLQGIVKSFSKIRILDKKCKILEDAGVILLRIRYAVNYYKPVIGRKLEGIVKNWSENEIGVLVDGFNTTLTNDAGKFEADVWRDANSVEIKKDSRVVFILDKIELESEYLRLIGKNPTVLVHL